MKHRRMTQDEQERRDQRREDEALDRLARRQQQRDPQSCSHG